MAEPIPMSAAAGTSSMKCGATASSSKPRSVDVIPSASEYGCGLPIGEVPDDRLQQRGGHLVGQRDQADVPEVEAELVFSSG